MRQLTLATAGFERYAKTTRRAAFLAEMERVVPWSALCALILPVYPKAGQGRPPIDPIGLGHRGVPQSAKLREDEPHPVAAFLACLQLGHGGGEDGRLRFYEALEIAGIAIRHVRPPRRNPPILRRDCRSARHAGPAREAPADGMGGAGGDPPGRQLNHNHHFRRKKSHVAAPCHAQPQPANRRLTILPYSSSLVAPPPGLAPLP